MVAFLNIAGGEIKKLNFLGNQIEFANPDTIPLALGLALTYFLVRFLQYAHDIEDEGLKKRFHAKIIMYLTPYLTKREFHKPEPILAQRFDTLDKLKVTSLKMFKEHIPHGVADLSVVNKKGGQVTTMRLKLSCLETLVPYTRATMYIAERTRLATDFIFPLIITVVAYSTYVPAFRISASKWI